MNNDLVRRYKYRKEDRVCFDKVKCENMILHGESNVNGSASSSDDLDLLVSKHNITKNNAGKL